MKHTYQTSLSYVHFYPAGLLTRRQRIARFFLGRKPAFWVLAGLILSALSIVSLAVAAKAAP